MSYPTLEMDDLSKVIELTATSNDIVERKSQNGSGAGFKGLEDVEADTAFNDGSANAKLLEKPNNHSELNDSNEQVSWCLGWSQCRLKA